MLNRKRATQRLLTMCVAAALLMAIAAGQATASRGRVLKGTFGGASSTTVDPYPLSPCESGVGLCQKWVAVDNTTGPSSGDVYVTDTNNHRIEKFSPDGSFILMFGENVNKTEVEKVGSTEAERNVCTAASGDTCQHGTEGTGPGAFVGRLLAVAVDSSSGPSAGDLYVANTTKEPVQTKKGEGAGEGTVTKFDENGKVISSWGVGGQMHGSGQPFGALNGIAVDPTSGSVWVYGTIERKEFSSGTEVFTPHPLVFELDQAGSLVTSWQPSQASFRGSGGIAVDAEHHVYLQESDTGIYKYEQSNGQFVSQLAVGEYMTSDFGAHTMDVVKSKPGLPGIEIVSVADSCAQLGFEGCTPVEVLSRAHPHKWEALAVNYGVSSDPIYVLEQGNEVAEEVIATVPDVNSLPATPVSTSAATLRGEIDPEGVPLTKCFFQWGEGAGEYEHEAPCEMPSAGEVVTGSGFVGVHAAIAIQAGKAYHYRLVAANASDAAEPVTGADILLGPPRIDSSSSAQVTSGSATLRAEIDPRNLATKYHFEYLTEAGYETDGESFSGPEPATSTPVVPGELTAGQKVLLVSAHLNGLQVHTAYRYRIVAENLLGEGAKAVAGPAEAFSTWGTGEFSLLDGRSWEMVSPPDKRGALVEPIGEDWIIQAAADGGRLAYVTRAPSEANPAGYLLYQSSLATRASGGGWTSRNLALPHTAASELSVGEGWEYRIFSEDLSSAIVQPFGAFIPCSSETGAPEPCLSPQATEQTAFLASNYKEAASSEACSEQCYRPLVTGAAGVANVPPETVFGQLSVFGKTCPPNTYCGPKFLDATSDLSHVLLESQAALTPSSAAKATVPPDSLYEWSGAAVPSEQLHLVSVLPGNSSHEAVPAQGPKLGYFEGNARQSISPDGSRVVFTAGPHVYLREHANEPQSPIGASGECLVPADACTVPLDAGLSGVAQFQTANSAVTRIFFTNGEGYGDKADLYEYDVEKAERVRLTTGANVVGSVIGASNDGSWLYFVGNGSLAPHAVTGLCETNGQSESSLCNLYMMHYDGTHWEAPTLIAVISRKDFTDWGNERAGYPAMTARVSPNGEWLAFMSKRRLSGYNNQDAVSNEPDAEVYEYDAATGELTCASCNRTGARPNGRTAAEIDTSNGGIAGGHQVFSEIGWIAANLPGWTPSVTSSTAIYQSRYLSDSGRLFFNSSDALVAKDTNGTEDVYEFEPEGVPAGEHSCTASAESGGVTFKPSRRVEAEGVEVQEQAGCVGLISSGESPNESGFLDATETGSEVFFITTGKLAAKDTDTSYDVYDARECTNASPCAAESPPPPKPCTEESSCKPPASPPPSIFEPSGSATFSGPGDLVQPLSPPVSKPKPLSKAQLLARALKVCRKDKVRKKRQACEKQARKRYGPKHVAKKKK